MPGGENVGPRDKHGLDRAVAKIDSDRLVSRSCGDELAVSADAGALVEEFDRRALRARRQSGGADRPEGEPQPRGGRQPPLQVQRQAIGRSDVEANAGHQHDAARLRLGVLGLQRLIDRDFAGNVEIMGAGAQARARHRLGGVFERPGAVQNDRDALQRAVDRPGVRETEGAALDPEPAAIRSSLAASRPATIVGTPEAAAVRATCSPTKPVAP